MKLITKKIEIWVISVAKFDFTFKLGDELQLSLLLQQPRPICEPRKEVQYVDHIHPIFATNLIYYRIKNIINIKI